MHCHGRASSSSCDASESTKARKAEEAFRCRMGRLVPYCRSYHTTTSLGNLVNFAVLLFLSKHHSHLAVPRVSSRLASAPLPRRSHRRAAAVACALVDLTWQDVTRCSETERLALSAVTATLHGLVPTVGNVGNGSQDYLTKKWVKASLSHERLQERRAAASADPTSSVGCHVPLDAPLPGSVTISRSSGYNG